MSAQTVASALGPTLWIATLPRLEGLQISQLFLCTISDGFAPRLAISPSVFTLCSHKIVKLSRGAIPFFPNHAVQGGEDEVLLLTILCGARSSEVARPSRPSWSGCSTFGAARIAYALSQGKQVGLEPGQLGVAYFIVTCSCRCSSSHTGCCSATTCASDARPWRRGGVIWLERKT